MGMYADLEVNGYLDLSGVDLEFDISVSIEDFVSSFLSSGFGLEDLSENAENKPTFETVQDVVSSVENGQLDLASFVEGFIPENMYVLEDFGDFGDLGADSLDLEHLSVEMSNLNAISIVGAVKTTEEIEFSCDLHAKITNWENDLYYQVKSGGFGDIEIGDLKISSNRSLAIASADVEGQIDDIEDEDESWFSDSM
jgi:hypothetical protein